MSMGNTHPSYPADTTRICIEPNPQSLDVALVCERDYYEEPGHGLCQIDGESVFLNGKMATRKKVFRDFLTELYGGDIIYKWTTWDTDFADIVPSENGEIFKDTKDMFDVVALIGCPISTMTQIDIDACCRLLKPNGILVIIATWKMNKSSRVAYSMNTLGPDESIPNCSSTKPLIPVARVPINNTKDRLSWSIEVWARSIKDL